MHFYAHIICDVETQISSRRGNRDFTGTEMVVSSETGKDFEDERTRRAFVVLLFSLSFSPASKFPEKILQVECSVDGQAWN